VTCHDATEGSIDGCGPRGLSVSSENTPGEEGSDECNPQSQLGGAHAFDLPFDEIDSGPASVGRPDREQQQFEEFEASERVEPDFGVAWDRHPRHDGGPVWPEN
jgi:hypothetical protein